MKKVSEDKDKLSDSEHIENSSDTASEWDTPSSSRLITGGFYQALRDIITGTLIGLWVIVVIPRLVPQPEVMGIIKIVNTNLSLVGIFFDLGVWRGFQFYMASSFADKNEEKILKYTQTLFFFKIINGILYNATIIIFLIYFFPNLSVDYTTAYYFTYIFVAFRWFFGFASMFGHVITSKHRFDYDFYISLVDLASYVLFSMLWLYICNTFLFSDNIITGNVLGLVMADLCRWICIWLVQAYAINKLKILNLKKALRLKFDKPTFFQLLKYGIWVVGRSLLGQLAEIGCFLWILILKINIGNPEAVLGYWEQALISVGLFSLSTNLVQPMFPAISEAYAKNDNSLIQKYWVSSMKWYFLWSFYAFGSYVGWGELFVVTFSGETWRKAGVLAALISPALFIRNGNEYLMNVANGINQPKHVMIGTALRIPILLIGGFFLFRDHVYIGMSIVFLLIEVVFFIYLLWQIKKKIVVTTPLWTFFVPLVACIGAFVSVELITMFINVPETIWGYLLCVIPYSLIFFVLFILLGGYESSDYEDFEKSLKTVLKSEDKARKIIKGLQKFARISPLYDKFAQNQLQKNN
ncbi:MAG: hypothetical protein GF364_17050 [Candidatus Lokiarchaeota archaeon]|nr:hypothetical protein [Candidatus Lokiarchaeota archaeon]